MRWLNCCTEFSLLLCLFVGPPPQAEDSFEFKKSDSGFRFAEVEIQPGLPEGFDQTGLNQRTPIRLKNSSGFAMEAIPRGPSACVSTRKRPRNCS